MAGVLLTKRDTFLTRAQYTQLLYAACCSSRPGADAAAAVGSLRTPPPAIWRPQPLYTGKQVGLLTLNLTKPAFAASGCSNACECIVLDGSKLRADEAFVIQW